MRFLEIVCLFLFSSCTQDPAIPLPASYKTKYVFVVVMDGARYSETWGDAHQTYIPTIKNLASQGIMCTNFYNDGQTLTVPGHTAITTSYYQLINNGGQEIPERSSIFQYYLSQYSKPLTDAWVISSKDKLEVLSNCLDPSWSGKFRPSVDCGVNGNGTGYREDSITYNHLVDTLTKFHPHLAIVNFREPDMTAHSNNWVGYLSQIQKVDKLVGDFWNFLQKDSIYAGVSTLLVTNDHGRNLDGVYDGFASHGCTCEGCRHIFLLGIGPDFKTNYIETEHYSLVDIAPTICELMGIKMPNAQGKVMKSILK